MLKREFVTIFAVVCSITFLTAPLSAQEPPVEAAVSTQISQPLPPPKVDREKIEADCYAAGKAFGIPEVDLVGMIKDCVEVGLAELNGDNIDTTSSNEGVAGGGVMSQKDIDATVLACKESVREHPKDDQNENYKACLDANLTGGSNSVSADVALPQPVKNAANSAEEKPATIE